MCLEFDVPRVVDVPEVLCTLNLMYLSLVYPEPVEGLLLPFNFNLDKIEQAIHWDVRFANFY